MGSILLQQVSVPPFILDNSHVEGLRVIEETASTLSIEVS